MIYENFLKFYEDNSDYLLYDPNGIRPVKSITRNIFNSVPKFYDWYFENAQKTLTFTEIADEVCKVNPDTGRSTILDNIVNMEQLNFLKKDEEDPELYHFTRNFIKYVESGENLDDYITEDLKQINSIESMTMFFNYILTTLREGVINGEIVLYPDSAEKFKNKVSDKATRIAMMEDVYRLYGFRGNNRNPKDDNYTPNINYRIVSTVIELGLIEKSTTENPYGLQTFVLTVHGKEVLNQLNWNLGRHAENRDVISNYESTAKLLERSLKAQPDNKGLEEILEELQDEIYELKSEECCPSLILDERIDRPKPISTLITSFERDPQKAANAKAMAEYTCEYDENHHTFTSESTGNQYVEAHHLIPISKQGEFNWSIDVEANIISLCPGCHMRIHHAIKEEKVKMIHMLLNKRRARLAKCNIEVSEEKLIEYYTKKE